MPAEEELKLLFDINECCTNIAEFVSEADTYNEYEQNKKLKKAIERDELVWVAVTRHLPGLHNEVKKYLV